MPCSSPHILLDRVCAFRIEHYLIHPRDNVIVIATHGRGMWALDANLVNKKAEWPTRRDPGD